MQKKSRANFLYRIGVFNGHKLLMIRDEDAGGMSVTNDIENVVADISLHESIDPKEHLIIYRDSRGNWDGWDPIGENFYPGALPVEIMEAITGQLLLETKASINEIS